MKRLLFIDDDRVVVSLYRSKLQADGFAVDVAVDGEIGIERLKAGPPPDLVLLDLGLPKISGVEVLKWVRSNPATAALPVIVFSTSYVAERVQDAWKAGANRCLTKSSCTPRELSEIVKATLAVPALSDRPSIAKAVVVDTLKEEQPRDGQTIGSMDGSSHIQERQAFLSKSAALMGDLRLRLQRFSERPAGGVRELAELSLSVRALAGKAGIVGLNQVAELSAALEAFLRQLQDDPHRIGPSPLRTIADAVGAITALLDLAPVASGSPGMPSAVLVLDKDKANRRAICNSLASSGVRAIGAGDPSQALLLLADNAFDLIVADADMPSMRLPDFCTQVRSLAGYRKTPVLLIASVAGGEDRVGFNPDDGVHPIAVPFLPIELVVKVLTHVYLKSSPTRTASESVKVHE